MAIYVGFHGTSKENVPAIKAKNFNHSDCPTDWLGTGVYFFMDGVGHAQSQAKDFALYRAHVNTFREYSVLRAEISARDDHILDLRTEEGLRKFNAVKMVLLHNFSAYFGPRRRLEEDNCAMHNFVKKHLGLDLLIQNLYIRYGIERRWKVSSLVPNSTVLCATSADNIDAKSIEVVEEGEVPNGRH